MSDPDDGAPERAPLVIVDAYLAERNVAANGRLFQSMLFLVDLCLSLRLGDMLFAGLALLAAVPVAAAVVLDQLPYDELRKNLALGAYALAIAVLLASLVHLRG